MSAGSGNDDHGEPVEPPGLAARVHPDRVDHLLHPLAVMIRGLLERAGDRILVDDEENILQALDAGVAIDSVFFAGENVLTERLLQRLPAGVPVHEIAPRTSKKIFEKDRISRVFAVAARPAMLPLERLLETPRDVVVVDNVSISGNLGAIIRTSLALGAGGLALVEGQLDFYDRRVIRASRGYLFSLPVAMATADALIRACERGRRGLVVMDPDGDTPVDQLTTLPGALAIVFGGEKAGCSPAIAAAATWRARIPMNPAVESLNVSAAAAITLFSRRARGA